MRRRILVFIGSFLAYFFLFFASSQTAVFAADADLLSSAKKEGNFLWYTSMQISQSTPLLKTFEEKYPFIKTGLYRASGEKVLNRFHVESRANKFLADCILVSGFHLFPLKKMKLLQKLVTSESESYPDYFKDPEGYWNGVYANTYVLAYNTKIIPPGTAPKNYEGLQDPKWKGKIGFDNEDYEWIGNILRIMGREKGISFLKAMAKQNLQIRHGHTLITELIVAGEISMGFVFAGTVEESKKKGAPIDWIALEPVVTGINVAVIPEKAPHPHAAMLFSNFILSREGQVLIRDLTSRIPCRADVEPVPARLTKGLKLFPSSPGVAEEAEELAKLGKAIFPISGKN